jgi:hypothetical protein
MIIGTSRDPTKKCEAAQNGLLRNDVDLTELLNSKRFEINRRPPMWITVEMLAADSLETGGIPFLRSVSRSIFLAGSAAFRLASRMHTVREGLGGQTDAVRRSDSPTSIC